MSGNAWRELKAVMLAVSLLLIQGTAAAAPAWYGGKIRSIYLHADGFFVSFVGPTVDDCLYDRVFVREATLGKDMVDRAYSMALSAQASGRSFTIVVDKSINGPEGVCDALNGSMVIKDLPN